MPQQKGEFEGQIALVRIERPIGPPPPLAVAPFTAEEAKKHQQAWADYLKVQPVVTTSSTNMKLTLIPPGEYLMGSPAGEKDRRSEEMQHRVRITKAFYLGVYEVTQAEYKAIMGESPSHFSATGGGNYLVAVLDTANFPVDNVSWSNATEFCRRMSQKDGKTYRLPTEAEWEYACRAGTTTPYHFGGVLNGDKANVLGRYPYGTTTKGRSLERTTNVGSYAPNGFGLYDMHGNVWEWCGDWYGEKYYESLAARMAEDPPGEETGSAHVLRGGAYSDTAMNTRAASRLGHMPDKRNSNFGFRVALPVSTP